MATCHNMHEGDIYLCEKCGLEIKVIKECNEVDKDCSHEDHTEITCKFSCCNTDLILK